MVTGTQGEHKRRVKTLGLGCRLLANSMKASQGSVPSPAWGPKCTGKDSWGDAETLGLGVLKLAFSDCPRIQPREKTLEYDGYHRYRMINEGSQI